MSEWTKEQVDALAQFHSEHPTPPSAKAEKGRVELLPCPWCGAAGEYWTNNGRRTTIVCCPDKDCIAYDIGATAEQWNRRLTPPSGRE